MNFVKSGISLDRNAHFVTLVLWLMHCQCHLLQSTKIFDQTKMFFLFVKFQSLKKQAHILKFQTVPSYGQNALESSMLLVPLEFQNFPCN